MKKKVIISIIVFTLIVAAGVFYLHMKDLNKPSQCNDLEQTYGKPVIYLYPKSKQDVFVSLDFKGKLICTYPQYKNGWKVIAKPNGTIINKEDNREYSYLFWEGKNNNKWDFSKGFVVKGEETREFLQSTLSKMGLTPKEYNEFIVYWLPKMEHNKYNLITFAGREYEELAKLNISPRPDSMLRVYMVYKPLEQPVKVEKQEIKPFERKGFVVVEWGGTEVK